MCYLVYFVLNMCHCEMLFLAHRLDRTAFKRGGLNVLGSNKSKCYGGKATAGRL